MMTPDVNAEYCKPKFVDTFNFIQLCSDQFTAFLVACFSFGWLKHEGLCCMERNLCGNESRAKPGSTWPPRFPLHALPFCWSRRVDGRDLLAILTLLVDRSRPKSRNPNAAFLPSGLVAKTCASGMAHADVIFCGNPGAGQSTLLSSISGVQFESGVSASGALTTELEIKESPKFPGIRFADTPGLDNGEDREKAARGITEAFKIAAEDSREVKLFFVITLLAGRIQAADLFTIRKVLESVKLETGKPPTANSYGIIVNKCDEGWNPAFLTTIKQTLAMKSDRVPFPTCQTIFLPFVSVPALQGKNNAGYDFRPQKLQDFVINFPGFEILEASEINVKDLDQELEAFIVASYQEIERFGKMLAEERARWEQEANARLAEFREEERKRKLEDC